MMKVASAISVAISISSSRSRIRRNISPPENQPPSEKTAA
jgi:hypothetical protein